MLATEIDGTRTVDASAAVSLSGVQSLDLFLALDPATGRITARYRINSDLPGAVVTLGSTSGAQHPGLADLFRLGLGGGILATNGASSPFGLAYDWFRIEP